MKPFKELSEIQALLKTLQIRVENGFSFPESLEELNLVIQKSSLLGRLLDGKEPLPAPPPKSFSHPWYSLIEDGFASPFEVWKYIPDDDFLETEIIINHTGWKLIEELNKNDYIVSYYTGNGDNRKLSDTKWHVYPIACKLPRHYESSESIGYVWQLELIG